MELPARGRQNTWRVIHGDKVGLRQMARMGCVVCLVELKETNGGDTWAKWGVTNGQSGV